MLHKSDITMSPMENEQNGNFYNLYFANMAESPLGGAAGYLVKQGNRIYFVSLTALSKEEKKEVCSFAREKFMEEDTPLLNLYICDGAGLYVIGKTTDINAQEQEPLVMSLDLQ